MSEARIFLRTAHLLTQKYALQGPTKEAAMKYYRKNERGAGVFKVRCVVSCMPTATPHFLNREYAARPSPKEAAMEYYRKNERGGEGVRRQVCGVAVLEEVREGSGVRRRGRKAKARRRPLLRYSQHEHSHVMESRLDR
jgi:hypothetical protein